MAAATAPTVDAYGSERIAPRQPTLFRECEQCHRSSPVVAVICPVCGASLIGPGAAPDLPLPPAPAALRMGRRAEEAWWDPEDEQLIAWGPALVVCRPEGTARRVRHAFSALSVHRAALKHGIDRIDVELPDEPPGPEPYLADVGPRRGVWTPERVGCGQGLLGHPAASLWLSAPGTKDKPLPLISVLDLRQRAMRAAEAGVRVGLRGVQADRFSEGGPWVLGAVCHAGRPDPRGNRYPVLLGFVSLTSSSSGLLLAGFLEATTVAAGRAGVSPVLQGLEFTQCGSVCPCSPPFVPTRLGMLARKEGGLGYEFDETPRQVLLHGHCHQKALANTADTRHLLDLPPAFQVEELTSGCCGMAGSFGYEHEHYDVSMEVGRQRVFEPILDADPETQIAIVGTSCRHQIADATGKDARHWAQILADAVK